METVYKSNLDIEEIYYYEDMFNKRQRFSLRKYNFGVASVLLGFQSSQMHRVPKPDGR